MRRDNPFTVAHDDVFLAGSQHHIQFRTRDGSGTCTVDNDFYIFNLLSGYFKRIEQTGTGDDCRTMLVVVHHRDIQFRFQSLFNLETFGRFDIFQVDTAESRGDCFYGFDELIGIFLVHFDIEYIDSCEDFKQEAFAFHNRFAGKRSDITQSQNSSTVGDNGYQITF